MEEGKLSIARKEYKKAENMFRLATQEKKNNEDTKALYNQSTKLIEAIELVEEDELYESINLLNEIININCDVDIVKVEAISLLESVEKEKNSKDDLVLDYVVYQSNEDIDGKIYRDSEGKIILDESDYLNYRPIDEERLVATHVPETSVKFSLKNIGNKVIANPTINLKFNHMAIEFEPNDVWKGINHSRGVGTWNEVQYSPVQGTTIKPEVPIDFRFGFENASIYSKDANIEVTFMGDNCDVKNITIPVSLKKI